MPAGAPESISAPQTRTQAALLARKLYLELCANGWEETMRRRSGDPASKKVNVTVGEYIEAVAARSLFSPKTFQSYAQALRKIAGDISGASKPREARCHQTAHAHS